MQENRKLRRKVRMSYAISTVSIAMVLFLLGSVSYLILSVMNAANRMQENVAVHVMLTDGLSPEQTDAVKGRLLAVEGVREAVFVSRDDAARDFIEYSGDDFTEFLDFNPLPDSFEVKMSAGGSDRDGVKALERTIADWDEVDEVVYQKGVVETISTNINKFNLVLMVFGLILLVISIILLNNTIRITVYSKRYIISTMKLVGATRGFVMKPFLRSAVWQGLYAALVALVMFAALVVGLHEGVPEITFVAEKAYLVWIAAGMVLTGVVISVAFTWFAVGKLVRMRTDDMHLY
ncbi:permease-like cell division protein FtsX [Alistipes sp. OttesenSCG-928-B03]|nr:permease-like cell division protein FtsX [Alistipes sp. OttesenSCG-928-B03]